ERDIFPFFVVKCSCNLHVFRGIVLSRTLVEITFKSFFFSGNLAGKLKSSTRVRPCFLYQRFFSRLRLLGITVSPGRFQIISHPVFTCRRRFCLLWYPSLRVAYYPEMSSPSSVVRFVFVFGVSSSK